jgi:hypothetical protein
VCFVLAEGLGNESGSGEQRFEARLFEVMIRREGSRQSMVLHHPEGNAVGERPVLVRAFAIELSAALDQFAGSAAACSRSVARPNAW